MTEEEQISQTIEKIKHLINTDEGDAGTSPDATFNEVSRIGFPLRTFFPKTEIVKTNEAEIKSVVNKTLSENMPMFEKMVSSMIDHKLSNLGFNPALSINLTEITSNEENEIILAFSPLAFIKNVSYSKHNSTIKLVVVHAGSDNLQAFESIEDTIIALEEKLPAYSIEPWILHESELQDSFLSQTKPLISK